MERSLSTALRAFFAGPLNQLLVNLGGDNGQVWESELNRFLRKEPCWFNDGTAITGPRQTKTWKTIKIGMQKSCEDLSKVLISNGFRISGWAVDVLKKVPLADTEAEIELVLATVAKLGFQKATRRGTIYSRARQLGLDLVPAEVGPQLRLAYTDQPMDEWILMAMEPVADSEGSLVVFSVDRGEDGQWLEINYGGIDEMWDPDVRWVFARRKQI